MIQDGKKISDCKTVEQLENVSACNPSSFLLFSIRGQDAVLSSVFTTDNNTQTSKLIFPHLGKLRAITLILNLAYPSLLSLIVIPGLSMKKRRFLSLRLTGCCFKIFILLEDINFKKFFTLHFRICRLARFKVWNTLNWMALFLTS